MDPHFVSMVTTLADLVPKDYFRDEGLERADNMSFLQALLGSLSQVCTFYTPNTLYFCLTLPHLTVFIL